jgi:hypothetical protein
MLRLGIHLATDLLEAPVPEAVAAAASADPAVRSLAEAVVRRQAAGEAVVPASLDLLPFMLATREDRRDRIRYLAYRCRRWIPPTERDERALPLPWPMGFLRYPFRPLRLLLEHGSRPRQLLRSLRRVL